MDCLWAICCKAYRVAKMHAVQAHGEVLGFAQLIVIACTATLAAIGAAAIPSAGLVTMIMVLQVQLCSQAG